MPQQRFGGEHTELKLSKVEDYLKAYTEALKNQDFRLIYFDAFAGTGDIPQARNGAPRLPNVDDYEPFIVGSALRALSLPIPFDEYVFVDSDEKKVAKLETLANEFPHLRERMHLKCADANLELQRFCADRDWRKWRAVIFLDPFGNQVEWKTIESIARTEAVDLWYLFPAGLGVHRQIARDGSVHRTHDASLDRILGTSDWRNSFVKTQHEVDLFGEIQRVTSKEADPDLITKYMINRMKGIFHGGVLDLWLPLGSRGVHMYSLIFAWANPSRKAKLAGKLAEAVLRSSSHGRTK